VPFDPAAGCGVGRHDDLTLTLAKLPHNLIDDQIIEDLLAAYRKVLAEGCRCRRSSIKSSK
jgi:hypothetical protein